MRKKSRKNTSRRKSAPLRHRRVESLQWHFLPFAIQKAHPFAKILIFKFHTIFTLSFSLLSVAHHTSRVTNSHLAVLALCPPFASAFAVANIETAPDIDGPPTLTILGWEIGPLRTMAYFKNFRWFLGGFYAWMHIKCGVRKSLLRRQTSQTSSRALP